MGIVVFPIGERLWSLRESVDARPQDDPIGSVMFRDMNMRMAMFRHVPLPGMLLLSTSSHFIPLPFPRLHPLKDVIIRAGDVTYVYDRIHGFHHIYRSGSSRTSSGSV